MFWFQNYCSICVAVRGNRQSEKWLPKPSMAKTKMAIYPNICVFLCSKRVRNFTLLSQNAQFGRYRIVRFVIGA